MGANSPVDGSVVKVKRKASIRYLRIDSAVKERYF
jgi:hypothetical protein